MSEELSATEKAIEEVLIDLMTERVMLMSEGIQDSSTRDGKESLSTTQARASQPVNGKRTKNRDDLMNAKLILNILPTYIPHLSSAINHDSVPKEFEYALVTAYLPKGIHAVHKDQDKIAALKFSDFNLGNRKVYNILAPHKYLTRTKEKKSKIVPKSWTHNLVQSTLLNVMKIPHFSRHQEVNACVKLPLSFYHGGYLWLNRRNIVDPTLIN
jgi:hypothetical protein